MMNPVEHIGLALIVLGLVAVVVGMCILLLGALPGMLDFFVTTVRETLERK